MRRRRNLTSNGGGAERGHEASRDYEPGLAYRLAIRRRRTNLALLGVLALALGLGLGLLYTWVISPVQYIDTAPNSLRAADQADYIQLAARAYSVDGDLGRARTRLALLGLRDPAQGVATQAQRAAAAGDQAGQQALAALAAAISGTPTATPTAPTGTAGSATDVTGALESGTGTEGAAATESAVETASATMTPSASPTPTETPRPTDTVVPSITPQLLPTRTATPTELAAFVFVGQQQVCDPRLTQPLIQVVTEDAQGNQIAGVEVVVTWDNGFDHFFTGLKPELGAGYGDFTMTSGVVYSVHLAQSPGVSIEGLSSESCSAPGGQPYPGSILLIFKQPG